MKYKIELRKVKLGIHSEETTDFTAEVWVDGKLVAHAENDGHGGNTNVSPVNPTASNFLKVVDDYFSKLPKYVPENCKFAIQPSLEDTVDNLLEDFLVAKDKKKFEAKLVRDCKKNLCFGTPERYYTIGWPGHTLEGLIGLNKPSGDAAVTKLIERIKREHPSEKILNTNLGRFQHLVK